MIKHTLIQLPLAIEDMTVEIPLTQGYVAIVDAIDADLSAHKWHTSTTLVGLLYAVRTRGTGRSRTVIRLHHVILARVLGTEISPDYEVDHVNGNGLDNARSNLRLASHAENVRNRRLYKNNVSGVRGVRWDKYRSRWTAAIRIGGKRIHLGSYDNINDAIAARLAAEQKYFGEFAPSLSRDK